MVAVSRDGADHWASASPSTAAKFLQRGLLSGCDLRRISIHSLKEERLLQRKRQQKSQE